jgi:probable phosphomutase (TIGR03848 family)
VTTVLLVRHGRTTANDAGVLAGWSEGVSLDETGQAQVRALAGRLTPVPLVAVVTSPLQRCRETTQLLLDGGRDVPVHADDRLGEVRYGDWSGQQLKKLAKEPLWKVVQGHPAGATFPGGESMAAMAARAVATVRRWDATVEADHGPRAVWAAVSHGDIIKAVLADALGMHLDMFQRINVDPASVSIVQYTADRPYVLASNTHAGDLSWLVRPAGKRTRRSGATVGGGAGPDPVTEGS